MPADIDTIRKLLDLDRKEARDQFDRAKQQADSQLGFDAMHIASYEAGRATGRIEIIDRVKELLK
jgi:hypothetical protein